MFRLFTIGIFLGIALSGAAAFLMPVADLQREPSLITVVPNGGNSELFRIRVPQDRLLAGGGAAQATPTPGTLRWPAELAAADIGFEVFKLRNRDGTVVGVASRIATSEQADPQSIEWVLHLPPRGSMYFPLAREPRDNGDRVGALRAGTREFSTRSGELRERFEAFGGEGDGGELVLETLLVATGGGSE